MSDRSLWMTLQQACADYGISVPTWRRWLSEGRLGSSRIGGRILVSRAEIDELLAENYKPGGSSARKGSKYPRSKAVEVDPNCILAELTQGPTRSTSTCGEA